MSGSNRTFPAEASSTVLALSVYVKQAAGAELPSTVVLKRHETADLLVPISNKKSGRVATNAHY